MILLYFQGTKTAMDTNHNEDFNPVEGDGNGDGILDESDIDRVIDLQDNGGMTVRSLKRL